MGVDLTLLPIECEMKGNVYSHSILELTRRRDLWGAVMDIARGDLEEPLSCYLAPKEALDGESGYGEVVEDRYGTRLKWCRAQDIVKLRDHDAVQDNPKNRAVWAYLAELPPETRVVLFWH